MSDPIPQQSTFDTVARHLRRQGRPSVHPVADPTRHVKYGGAYRGTEGCSCAAGCLIPDELYSSDMEGRGVADDQPAGIVVAGLGHDLGLVQQLQLLHDGLIETWSQVGLQVGLRELAGLFELSSHAVTEPL